MELGLINERVMKLVWDNIRWNFLIELFESVLRFLFGGELISIGGVEVKSS